jgi:hypothetical protein
MCKKMYSTFLSQRESWRKVSQYRKRAPLSEILASGLFIYSKAGKSASLLIRRTPVKRVVQR